MGSTGDADTVVSDPSRAAAGRLAANRTEAPGTTIPAGALGTIAEAGTCGGAISAPSPADGCCTAAAAGASGEQRDPVAFE